MVFSVEEHQASDGYRWKYRKYPAVARRAVLSSSFTASRAIRVYGYSCTQLARAGYDVYFLDRRGSGMNEQDRGDAPGFRRLLDDLAEFLAALPRSVSRGNSVVQLPVFLAAISWAENSRRPGAAPSGLDRWHGPFVSWLFRQGPADAPAANRHFLRAVVSARKKYPVPLNEPIFSPHRRAGNSFCVTIHCACISHGPVLVRAAA